VVFFTAGVAFDTLLATVFLALVVAFFVLLAVFSISFSADFNFFFN